MKKILLCFLLLIISTNLSYSKQYTITNSGFSFSPSTLTINVGDTVNFTLSSIHNAREVDQATWNANDNTSNGGFNTSDGGGMVIFNQAGTVYYVCEYHASMGMKGIINVSSVTGISTANNSLPNSYILMQNFPNPFNPTTIIRYALPYESRVSLKIYDLVGKQISEPLNKIQNAGFHNITFQSANLASGVYFYRIDAVAADGQRKFTSTRKMIILK